MRWVAMMFVGLSVLLVSCNDDPVGVPSDSRSDIVPVGIPPEQQEAFADGRIELGEYQAAFGLFRDCASAAGFPLANVQTDPVIGLISYGVTGELSPPGVSSGMPIDDCYQRYFSFIEQTWQTTDPGVAAKVAQDNVDFFRTVMQPCLEKNGVVVPPEVLPGSQVFGELSRQFTDLSAAGLCVP